MDNEYLNLTGFSHRAQNPEFREEIRGSRQKSVKRYLIATLISLGLTLISILIIWIFDHGVETTTMAFASIIAICAIPVFLIATVVLGIITVAKQVSDTKNLGKDCWDGKVLEKKHWVTTSTDDDGTTREHDNYLITIEKQDGKQFKVKGNQARAFLPYVEAGDRVRYHPGFPYPLELFDKSQHLSNVCVFCGARNDARKITCEKCGKPMLI